MDETLTATQHPLTDEADPGTDKKDAGTDTVVDPKAGGRGDDVEPPVER